MRSVAVLFLFVLILGAVMPARADEFVSVLVGGDQTTVVDSLTLKRSGRSPLSVNTPGFIAEPGAEDSVNIGTQPWPGEYIRVSYLYGFTRQASVGFPAPVQDSFYELPGTSSPATIKFLLMGGVAEQAGASRGMTGLAISPNPTTGRAALSFNMEKGGLVCARVVNTAGRTVRTLAQRSFPAGARSLLWDGRDDSGRQVEPAVYYIVVSRGSTAQTGKLLLTR
jgi:hypothetical protein